MSYTGFAGYPCHPTQLSTQLSLMTSNSSNTSTDSPSCSSSGGTDNRTNSSTNVNNNINLSSNQENHIQSALQSTPPLSSPSSVCALTTPYDSRIISGYPRLGGLYGPSYSDQNTFYTSGANPFYSSFGNPYDLKDANSNGWSAGLPQSTACYLYDPIYNPYGERYGPIDGVARRKNVTRDSTTTLKAWLNEHRKNPYPTKGEKIMLAIITKMTLTQVSTWFANARRRLKKENKMTWEPRNRSDGYDSDDNDSCKDIDDNSSNIADNICLNGDRKDSESFLERSGLIGLTSRHMDSDSVNSYPLVKESIGEKISSEHSPNGNESKNFLSNQMNNISRAHSVSNESIPKNDSTQNVLDSVTNIEAIGQRPKIWSLAQTATEDKPKSPLSHFNHTLNPNMNLNPFLHLSANIHATALSAQTPPNMSGWCHSTHSSVSPYSSVNPYGSHYIPSLGRHFAHPSTTSLPPQADTPPQTPPGLKLAQMQLLSAESGALPILATQEQVTCVESHKLITYGNRGESIGRSGTGSTIAGNTSPLTHSNQIYGTDFRISSDTLSESSHSFSSAISTAVHLQTQNNSHNNDNNNTNHK